ncbi:MAG: phage major capsid protein [Alphaproteobacteria bacterium]|nr:phage major capsid protein [Alphaproteobacteria bacterium]
MSTELKNLIEDQGRAWEEFKRTNDSILKGKAEGKVVAELEEKLGRLNSALDQQLTEFGRSFAGGGGAQGDEPANELKQFNAARMHSMPGGARLMEVDRAAYVEYKAAFDRFCRVGISMMSQDEVKALSAGTDTEGGFLLPASTIGRVVAKVFELSPIRQIASVMTISGPALEGLLDNGEADCGWVGETSARTETNTPAAGKYRIEPMEMYAAPKVTQTLLDDAGVDVDAWLASKVANKFARMESAAYVNGLGVVTPRGFATYPTAATADDTRPWGTIEHVATGQSADFPATNPGDKLIDVVAAVKPAYQQNAKWVTRREVIAKVRKFKEATTNAYIWQPGLQQGQPATLMGYPIVIAQDIPTLAANSLSMWFGDWEEAYQIVDRIGMRTLRDPFTNKPYVIFYSTKRTGGAVVNFEAIKAVKFI